MITARAKQKMISELRPVSKIETALVVDIDKALRAYEIAADKLFAKIQKDAKVLGKLVGSIYSTTMHDKIKNDSEAQKRIKECEQKRLRFNADLQKMRVLHKEIKRLLEEKEHQRENISYKPVTKIPAISKPIVKSTASFFSEATKKEDRFVLPIIPLNKRAPRYK